MVEELPAFFLGAGTLVFDTDGDPLGLVQARYIYLNEDEYRHIVHYLRRRKSIDAKGNRLDETVPATEHPLPEDS
jgi:hypothetical protein